MCRKQMCEVGCDNMEKGLEVIVGVVSDDKTPTAQVVARLMKIDGVSAVYELTGNFDIMVRAQSHSAGELNKMIEKMRICEGVVSTNTYLVLEKHENR